MGVASDGLPLLLGVMMIHDLVLTYRLFIFVRVVEYAICASVAVWFDALAACRRVGNPER